MKLCFKMSVPPKVTHSLSEIRSIDSTPKPVEKTKSEEKQLKKEKSSSKKDKSSSKKKESGSKVEEKDGSGSAFEEKEGQVNSDNPDARGLATQVVGTLDEDHDKDDKMMRGAAVNDEPDPRKRESEHMM